ncbi:hypothetical protein GobsT_64060 [Gemmata obscuriglobus]|uniref:DUF4274 domain-containing protein n=1 Tax=Gemmata obscuriglobus TaxID=114 RepID=A0A2Z3GNQ3_9BACT|nr:DUF4274 domain-containing protein [Gemmata obscuriglobus]AWM35869.1 DUF4274 domain-containing protein [Gemmata obscuriglobus]QEG31584.1 hypothetical protein GobsT_64060 [Gemmata obscuriglobus]VTS10926.1 Uncharacterized protein OS=Shewanella woodyi (strain ATCC 51908 / MS32) GN=Swoo_3491 PE=4 SV=1: DUF4274 [Gemmata obscuriglobus UQM 2246]
MDAARLHEWVATYNWDDGLAPVWAIAEWPRTEFATALLIYWRLGGPWLEGDAAPGNAHAVRLQAVVRERLLVGFYLRGASRYDPAAEMTRVQLHQFRKAGVPEVLLLACGPEAEPGAAPDTAG